MRVEFVLDVEASYSISPFASDGPMGMSISDGLELGAVFTVGLPLDVTADLDLSSGFYVKLNDGPGFSIAILGIDVSRIKSYGLISRYCRCGGGRLWIAGLLTVMGRRNGGQFEFFPVVVENARFCLHGNTSTRYSHPHLRRIVLYRDQWRGTCQQLRQRCRVHRQRHSHTQRHNTRTCRDPILPVDARCCSGGYARDRLTHLRPGSKHYKPVGYTELGFYER